MLSAVKLTWLSAKMMNQYFVECWKDDLVPPVAFMLNFDFLRVWRSIMWRLLSSLTPIVNPDWDLRKSALGDDVSYLRKSSEKSHVAARESYDHSHHGRVRKREPEKATLTLIFNQIFNLCCVWKMSDRIIHCCNFAEKIQKEAKSVPSSDHAYGVISIHVDQ